MRRLSVLLTVALSLPPMMGLAQSPAPAPAPAFLAAEIHLRPHGSNALPSMTGGMLHGDRYDFRNVTMLTLIATAYGVAADRVVGGPPWLDWNRFDVVGKTPPGATSATVGALLQSLLAERFGLVARQETRPVAGAALVRSNGGPKLRASTTPGAGGCDTLPVDRSTGVILAGLTCHGVTMDVLANTLAARAGGYVSGPVVNATSLDGAWDLDLRWTPRLVLAQAGADGVTLLDAVEKQLGLRIEPRDVPASVVVVDRVNETPSPNPSGAALDLPAPPPAVFDVAEVKIAPPDMPPTGRLQPGGRIDLQGFTLKALIRLAWTLNDDDLLAGGPGWLDSTKYGVVARSTTAIAGTAGNMQIDIDDLRLMLRALIVERFKLETHVENRPVTAYVLTADKPKLRRADPGVRTSCQEGPAPGEKDPRLTNPILSRLVTCRDMTMVQLTEELPRIAGGYIRLPVVNETGLDGAWDFTLSFTPAGQVAGAGRGGDAGAQTAAPIAAPMPADPTGGLSVFDALSRQLGLKLETRKSPMPVLVIDRVNQQPSDD